MGAHSTEVCDLVLVVRMSPVPAYNAGHGNRQWLDEIPNFRRQFANGGKS